MKDPRYNKLAKNISLDDKFYETHQNIKYTEPAENTEKRRLWRMPDFLSVSM